MFIRSWASRAKYAYCPVMTSTSDPVSFSVTMIELCFTSSIISCELALITTSLR